jgi:DNA repair exonuclease SbcCD ATPase subunit
MILCCQRLMTHHADLSSDNTREDPANLSRITAELDTNLVAFTDWACRVEGNLRQHISELEQFASNQISNVQRSKNELSECMQQVKLKDESLKDVDNRLKEAKTTISELLEHITQLEKDQHVQKSKAHEIEEELGAIGVKFVERESAKDKELIRKDEQVTRTQTRPSLLIAELCRLQVQELTKQLQVLAATYRALATEKAGLQQEAQAHEHRRYPRRAPPP